MSKPDAAPPREGELTIPFNPFYNSPLPIGTKCIISSEEDERYVIKFPDRVGCSGTYHIKKTYVREIEIST